MLASSRGPRAAARPAGGVNPSPTTNGGPATNREAATTRTAVGRDALIPPGSALSQVSAGGINPSPTTNGGSAAKPDSRNHPGGRRAGCPHPAGTRAAANTHGRIWNPPLRNGKACGQPGSRTLCGIANLCRGRCLHRPGDLAPPQGPREGHGPPLQTFRTRPAKPDSRNHPGGRRAGCPHPAGLCGKTTPEF